MTQGKQGKQGKQGEVQDGRLFQGMVKLLKKLRGDASAAFMTAVSEAMEATEPDTAERAAAIRAAVAKHEALQEAA